MTTKERLDEIEQEIEEIRGSLPAHSIPTAMLLNLEELEEEREGILISLRGESDAAA